MKFILGDKVRIIKNVSVCKAYDNDIGKISTIEEISNIVGDNYPYTLKDFTYGFTEEELELVERNIEVGDIVRIKKDITLGELPQNYWNGCQISTMDFLRQACISDFEKEYEVITANSNYITIYDFGRPVNIKLFEVVKKKKKEEVKEMTIKEISEALGYEVKIVKEDE